MKMCVACLFAVSVAVAGIGPNVRVDHQNQPACSCCNCTITIGPGAPSHQPLYVAFEGDSLPGGRCDIWFQKSTDGGRTWLPADLLIRRGDRYAFYPDITTDSDGNVYIVYIDEYVDTVGARYYHISCERSSDGGVTWTAPARVDDSSNEGIGSVRIAADSAGNLLCVWNDNRTGSLHIWSAVSTDRGATWRQNVQVDDDTTDYDCYQPDVFVQPGTNHYLVTAQVPRWFEVSPYIRMCAYLYRSTDCGQTFRHGVQLDTFDYGAGSPHVVADRDHIICDYFGSGPSAHDRMLVEARTFYTQPDTWGTPYPVTNVDSLHSLYYSGGLALSADGRVHTALTIADSVEWGHDVYYSSSSDRGVSWSDRVPVNEDTTGDNWYPDIGADSAGHAYVVWEDFNRERGYIWFATNNPAGIAEGRTTQAPSVRLAVEPNVFRRTTTIRFSSSSLLPALSSLSVYDASGRLIRTLAIRYSPFATRYSLSWDGRNASGTRCPAGLYVIRCGTATAKVTFLPAE